MSDKMKTATETKTLINRLLFAVVFMFAFGFALVPLYDVFCQVTGINGRVVIRADEADVSGVKAKSLIDTSRTIRVEFITRTANGSHFKFVPLQRTVTLHPGEVTEVSFSITNPTAKRKFAQAIPSVSPGQASLYLNKTECFCFNQQELQANQETVFPMRFFLDQDLPDEIEVLTVSYTLYQIDSAATARVEPADKGDS